MSYEWQELYVWLYLLFFFFNFYTLILVLIDLGKKVNNLWGALTYAAALFNIVAISHVQLFNLKLKLIKIKLNYKLNSLGVLVKFQVLSRYIWLVATISSVCFHDWESSIGHHCKSRVETSARIFWRWYIWSIWMMSQKKWLILKSSILVRSRRGYRTLKAHFFSP